MKTKLIQVTKRIDELNKLADEVFVLAEKLSRNENVQPEIAIKGQKWYRGARELLIQYKFSGLKEFDDCYNTSSEAHSRRSFTDIELYINKNPIRHSPAGDFWSNKEQGKENFSLFVEYFQKARSLVESLIDEISSRELDMATNLSLAISSDEFNSATETFRTNPDDDLTIRVCGILIRIALERHLFTIAESKSIDVVRNPPSKKKADVSDLLNALEKNSLVTPIQKSELESLFKIGNFCAHPHESVTSDDVKRLIERGRELASIIN